jgi:hypothetical protein
MQAERCLEIANDVARESLEILCRLASSKAGQPLEVRDMRAILLYAVGVLAASMLLTYEASSRQYACDTFAAVVESLLKRAEKQQGETH